MDECLIRIQNSQILSDIDICGALFVCPCELADLELAADFHSGVKAAAAHISICSLNILTFLSICHGIFNSYHTIACSMGTIYVDNACGLLKKHLAYINIDIHVPVYMHVYMFFKCMLEYARRFLFNCLRQ